MWSGEYVIIKHHGIPTDERTAAGSDASQQSSLAARRSGPEQTGCLGCSRCRSHVQQCRSHQAPTVQCTSREGHWQLLSTELCNIIIITIITVSSSITTIIITIIILTNLKHILQMTKEQW